MALFKKQPPLDPLNATFYLKTMNEYKDKGLLSNGLQKLLTQQITMLKDKGSLRRYDEAIFKEAMDNAVKAMPKDQSINPLEFKSKYRELLKAFEKVPSFNGMESKAEAMMIMHNLSIGIRNDKKDPLLGQENHDYFLSKIPSKYSNAKNAQVKLDNILYSINDEIKRLENIQKKMEGSSSVVKKEIQRHPDYEAKQNAFKETINQRISQLNMAKKNVEGIKQQVVYQAKLNPGKEIQISQSEAPKSVIAPEVKPEIRPSIGRS